VHRCMDTHALLFYRNHPAWGNDAKESLALRAHPSPNRRMLKRARSSTRPWPICISAACGTARAQRKAYGPFVVSARQHTGGPAPCSADEPVPTITATNSRIALVKLMLLAKGANCTIARVDEPILLRRRLGQARTDGRGARADRHHERPIRPDRARDERFGAQGRVTSRTPADHRVERGHAVFHCLKEEGG
jgi:hypothetical protein